MQGVCFTRVTFDYLFPLAILVVNVVSWIIVTSNATIANSQSTPPSQYDGWMFDIKKL